MSIYNPNRFVTGLTDISYVKQVNRIQKTRRKEDVPVYTKPEVLVVKDPTITYDRFVKDPYTPEKLPDNIDE